jgi:LuxR family transcriptional regulator, maltose regulon positive regulatory protein
MPPVLLGTKTYLSQPKTGWVRRSRLLDILNQAARREQRLVLLSSTAGSGKSTLLSDWAAQSNADVAWLALDQQDNAPAIFWAYLIAALQRRFPAFGQAVQRSLLSPQPPPGKEFIPDLLNQIADLPGRVVLILDDYHAVDQPEVHEGMIYFIDHCPQNLLLILATRVDPPMPLSRWRARGDLVEVRADNLRFDKAEAAEFLNGYMGLSLDEADVTLLETRTEGWAAGLQLAGLSMQGKPDPKGFISRFSASHQYILDYLTSEVLAQQPEEIQNFLVRTAVLNQLQADLCNQVLGIENSSDILDRLYRENLFVIALDDQLEWYRYHHLFAELLQIRFARLDKQMAAELHLRATGWYEGVENIDEALRHALAGGYFSYAGNIVRRSWQKTAHEGYLSKAERWFALLPRDLIEKSPFLCSALGWILTLTGKPVEAALLAEKAERMLEDRALLDDQLQAEDKYNALAGQVAGLHALLAVRNSDMPRVLFYGQKAMRLVDPSDFFTIGTASMTLAAAYRQQGQMEESIEILKQSLGQIKKNGNALVTNITLYYLGKMLLAQGRLREASALFENALAETKGALASPGISGTLLGLSTVYYEQNQMEQARAFFAQYQELNRRGGSSDLYKHGLILQAQILQEQGEGQAAQNLIANELLPASSQEPFFISPAKSFQILMQVRNQQYQLAEQWVETVNPTVTGHPGFAGMFTLLHLARVYLGLQMGEQALSLLEQMAEAAQASRSIGWQIEIFILQALAYAQNGQMENEQQALANSLDLAEPEGFTRLYLDEGEPMRQLLEKTREAMPKGTRWYYLEHLISAFHGQMVTASTAPGTQPELAEAISQRELEVLQLLAEGMSNQEIASRLYISLATVKTHVIHIFGKLSVQNRVEAVNQARKLGLI